MEISAINAERAGALWVKSVQRGLPNAVRGFLGSGSITLNGPASPNLTDCIKQSVHSTAVKSPTEPDLLHLLFPNARAEVLKMLFRKPNEEWYGREAARASTLALRTVQREFAMLEAVGLIVSQRKKRMRLFRANRDHRLFRPLQQLVTHGDSGRPFVNRAKRARQRRKKVPRAPSTEFSWMLRRRMPKLF